VAVVVALLLQVLRLLLVIALAVVGRGSEPRIRLDLKVG
jgi:hypothetical protein